MPDKKSDELLQHEELHKQKKQTHRAAKRSQQRAARNEKLRTYNTMMDEAAKQRDLRTRLRIEKEALEIKKMIDKKESRGAAEDHLYNAIHKNAAAIGSERVSSEQVNVKDKKYHANKQSLKIVGQAATGKRCTQCIMPIVVF